MTDYDLLVKILGEILDKAESYKTDELLDIWKYISDENWEVCNEEIVPVPDDDYYD